MSENSIVVDGTTDNDPITCSNCERMFTPQTAHRIDEKGPNTAYFACPWCHCMSEHDPPEEEIEHPAVIAGRTIHTSESGLVTTKLLFEDGSWLQFRETEDGWVREEMFNVDGQEIESFTAEFTKEHCEDPTVYLDEEAKILPTYTKTGLRIQRPHVAAVLLDGQ